MLEQEAGLFNCETCEVRLMREQLSEANTRALNTFALLVRRVVLEFHLAPLVFDALRLRLTPEDAVLLVEQLDLIYTHRYPVEKARG